MVNYHNVVASTYFIMLGREVLGWNIDMRVTTQEEESHATVDTAWKAAELVLHDDAAVAIDGIAKGRNTVPACSVAMIVVKAWKVVVRTLD